MPDTDWSKIDEQLKALPTNKAEEPANEWGKVDEELGKLPAPKAATDWAEVDKHLAALNEPAQATAAPTGSLPAALAPKAKAAVESEPTEDAKYETKLAPDKEAEFQKWFEDNRAAGNITKGDYDFYKKNGYGAGYDFRAAFDKGLTPSENRHWSDYGKKPSHETFSDESKYANEPGAQPGHWEGEQFTPWGPKPGEEGYMPPKPEGTPAEQGAMFEGQAQEPKRGVLAGTIDKATQALGKAAALTLGDLRPDVANAPELQDVQIPQETPEQRQKYKDHLADVVSNYGAGIINGQTFGLYSLPPLTDEQKSWGADTVQTAGQLLGMAAPIKKIAGIVAAEGVKGVYGAMTTGLIFDTLLGHGTKIGKWLAGEPEEPEGPGIAGLTASALAQYVKAPEVATQIAQMSAEYRPIDTALTFGLVHFGFDKILKPLAKAFGMSMNPTYEEWLGPHIQQGMERDLAQAWQTAHPQAGEGRPSAGQLADWFNGLDKKAQADVMLNSQFYADMQQHVTDHPEWKVGEWTPKETPAPTPQPAGRGLSGPMETGTEEGVKVATQPVEEAHPPGAEGVTEPPVKEATPAKQQPMGPGPVEVTDLGEQKPPAVPGPEEGTPAAPVTPKPIAPPSPIGVTGDGLESAEVRPAQVAPPEKEVQTPAPEEIAPQQMTQSLEGAKEAPTTPVISQDENGWFKIEGVEHPFGSMEQAQKAAEVIGRANTFQETAPAVQTRPEKITSHEDIAQQTKVNAITFKKFQDLVTAQDWPKVKEELHLSSANFTQAAFEHHFNPLNLMGRLVDGHMDRQEAKVLVKAYEQQAFAPHKMEMAAKGGTFKPSPVVGMQDLLKGEPVAEGTKKFQASPKAITGPWDIIESQVDHPGKFMLRGNYGVATWDDLRKAKIPDVPAGKNKYGAAVFDTQARADEVSKLLSVAATGARAVRAATVPIKEEFLSAVKGTPGAKLTEDGLHLQIARYQKPEQGGGVAIRTGVFYMPKGSSALQKNYGTTRNPFYGGPQKLVAEAVFKNPIVSKGSMGGGIPEQAYDDIRGKGATKALETSINNLIGPPGWRTSFHQKPYEVKLAAVSEWLQKNGGDPQYAHDIIEHSRQSNQLRYALQEHVIAHAVREAGHDGVIGYTKQGGGPHFTEIFDVRQGEYPWKNGQVFRPGNFPEHYEKHPVTKPAATLKGTVIHIAPTPGGGQVKVPIESEPPAGSPWSKGVKFQASLKPISREVGIRKNTRDVVTFEVSVPMSKLALAPEQMPPVPMLTPKDARAYNADPARVKDFLKMYDKAIIDKALNDATMKVGDSGKTKDILVIRLSRGCQRTATTLERVHLGIYPQDTRVEWCYEEQPAPGQDPKTVGGGCFANENWTNALKSFENINVKPLHLVTPEIIEQWFEAKPKKGEDNKLITALKKTPFIRQGDVGCDSHTIASGAAEAWLQMMQKHNILTSKGYPKKTIFVSAGYAPVTDAQYKALAKYADWMELHISTSGWFIKPELMIRFGEYWAAEQAGVPVTMRIITNADKLGGFRTPNHEWFLDLARKYGVQPWRFLETPYHNNKVPQGRRALPDSGWRSKATGEFPYVCCENDAKCLSCGVKCMTHADKTGSIATTWQVKNPTYSPTLEQDGDKVVNRPGIKFQASVKEVRETAPIYYSQMAKFLGDKLPGRGQGDQLADLIENWAGLKEVGRNKNDVPIFSKAEFKQDELKWSGLIPWLRGQKGPVTKQQVAQFIQENATRVGDIVRGKPTEAALARIDAVPGSTGFVDVAKYEQYSMPGPKENYRERLITLPEMKSPAYDKWQTILAKMQTKYGDSFWTKMTISERDVVERAHRAANSGSGAVFKGPHWQEPNVVVHTRGANRVDTDGKKAYVLEENQGDWHQAGRREGYAQGADITTPLEKAYDALEKEHRQLSTELAEVRARRIAMGEEAQRTALNRPMKANPTQVGWTKSEFSPAYSGYGDKITPFTAETLGNFTVHRKVVDKTGKPTGRSWVVSHLHTGYLVSMDRFIGDAKLTKAQAVAFAEYLGKYAQADWTFKDVDGFKGDNQNRGLEDLTRAALAAGIIPRNTSITGPAPIMDNWLPEHKAGAKKLDARREELAVKSSELDSKMGDLHQQIHAAQKGVPAAPFSKTWPELGMKRALREAAEDPSIERLEWTAGAVQYERWGSERIDWKKGTGLTLAQESELNRLTSMRKGRPLQGDQLVSLQYLEKLKAGGGWTVAVKEQNGGFAGGVDIENTARDRGHLLEDKGVPIHTKEELRLHVRKYLGRERTSDENSKLVDRIWDRMQTEDEGSSLPRKEGMEAFYDKMLPDFMKKYGKQWGATVGQTTVPAGRPGNWVLEPRGTENVDNWFIRGQSGVVSNHDLFMAGMAYPDNFSHAVISDKEIATKIAEKLFGEKGMKTKANPVWYIDITPAMRESVLFQGQPQFSPKEINNEYAQRGSERAVSMFHGEDRPNESAYLPQAGAGSARELDAIQAYYSGNEEAEAAGVTTARHAPGQLNNPDFRKVVDIANAAGVHRVFPITGGDVEGLYFVFDGDGKPVIFVDMDATRAPGLKIGIHEVEHHLQEMGSPEALARMARVNTNSPAFKAYKAALAQRNDAIGVPRLPDDQIIREVAADYKAGVNKFTFMGHTVDVNAAMRPAQAPTVVGRLPRAMTGRPATMQASPRGPPKPKAAEDILVAKYKDGKVPWQGKIGLAKYQSHRTMEQHRKLLAKAVGEKKYGPKAHEMDKVLNQFIDTMREPMHLAAFYNLQPPHVQAWLDRFAEVSGDPNLMTIVEKIKGRSTEIATEAFDEEVIREAFENHMNRIYKEESRPATEARSAFKLTSKHRLQRKFQTRLEARAANKEFQVETATEGQKILGEEIGRVIANRQEVERGLKAGYYSTEQHPGWHLLPQQMYQRKFMFRAEPEAIIREINKLTREVKNSSTTSTSVKGGATPAGVGAPAAGPVKALIEVITNSLELRGVAPAEAQNYVRRVQQAAINSAAKGEAAATAEPVEGEKAPETVTTVINEIREVLVTKEKEQKVMGHTFPEIRVKGLYMNSDGAVFQKLPLYGPPDVAKDVHNILDNYDPGPVLKTAAQYNAALKAGRLTFSPFHIGAFMRNMLTIPGKFLSIPRPIAYYRAGVAAMESNDPLVVEKVERGFSNGLTIFEGNPNFSELDNDQQTALGKLLSKNVITKATNDLFWKAVEANANFIFQKMGTAYKVQFYLDWYDHLMNKFPELGPDKAAFEAAQHTNDVFGGKNEQLSGTLFGDRLSSSARGRFFARLFILAYDWTTTNVRLAARAFQGGAGGYAARRYWAFALGKVLSAVLVINLLMALGDDLSAWDAFKSAFVNEPRKLRWLDMNVTPIYRLACKIGGMEPDEARKYLRLGGHFYDVFKAVINPVDFIHHKVSVIGQMIEEMVQGENWQGHAFTSVGELLGYSMPVTGSIAGQLTKEEHAKGMGVGYAQLPSFVGNQIRSAIPIPSNNLLSAAMGEMDWFTGVIKTAGLAAESFKPKTEAQKLMGEYYQNVSPSMKSSEQKERTELKKQLFKTYRAGDVDAFREGLQDAMAAGTLSHQEAQQWADEAPLPPGVQSFVKLPIDMAIKTMTAATQEEKDLWAPFLLRKLGQANQDTLMKHQSELVALTKDLGLDDTADVLESLSRKADLRALNIPEPADAEMHRIDLLENMGALDSLTAGLLRGQALAKPKTPNPARALGASLRQGGVGNQRKSINKLLGIR